MTSPEQVPAAAAPTPPTSARPFPLALVSFIAGAAANLVQFLMQFVVVLLVSSVGYLAVQPAQLVAAALSLVLGIAALVTGIIALLRRGAPKGLAAAGTALGAVVVLGTLVSLVQALLLTLV